MIRPVAFFTVLSVACVFLIGCASGTQLSGVAYGTITEVSQQEKDNTSGKAAGAVIGGLIGLGTSSGRSNRTTLLRSGAGAAAGAAVGGAAASGTVWVYTVDLVNGGTLSVVMDNGVFHQGDCVAVEQGRTNNMRRVSHEFCLFNEEVPEEYKSEHVEEANECAQAKQELLAAETEEAINFAHMKMNILCQD